MGVCLPPLSLSPLATADTDFVSRDLLQVNILALGISWLMSILSNPSTSSLEIWSGNPVVKFIFAERSAFSHDTSRPINLWILWVYTSTDSPVHNIFFNFSYASHGLSENALISCILIFSVSFLSSSLNSKYRDNASPSRNNGVSDATSGISSRLATNSTFFSHAITSPSSLKW